MRILDISLRVNITAGGSLTENKFSKIQCVRHKNIWLLLWFFSFNQWILNYTWTQWTFYANNNMRNFNSWCKEPNFIMGWYLLFQHFHFTCNITHVVLLYHLLLRNLLGLPLSVGEDNSTERDTLCVQKHILSTCAL